MRSISRVCDVSINTVTKLLEDAGKFCLDFHDRRVRGLNCQRVQVDEIWSFNYAKAANLPTAKAAPTGRWRRVDLDEARCRQQAHRAIGWLASATPLGRKPLSTICRPLAQPHATHD